MRDVMVSVQDLVVRFGKAEVLHGISFDVAEGEVVGLVGPNGCGKSTTLRAVTGLQVPTVGSVLIDGHRAGSAPARMLTSLVPDDPSGTELLTVSEFCGLVGRLWGNPGTFRHRVPALLNVFGLGERGNQLMGSLSNGQRRIVSMVASSALEMPVWVIDEATAALDPEAVVLLRELVRLASRDGAAVLFATQDLAFAQACSDRTVLLSAGQVLDDGSPGDLMARHGASTLEAAFMSATFGAGRLGEVRRVLEAL